MVGTTLATVDVPLLRVVVAKAGGFHPHPLSAPAASGLRCMAGRKSCSAVADADHGDACGRRYLAEGVVVAFTLPSFTSDARGNPRSGSPDQAAATPRCRYLLEDVVQAIEEGPMRLSEFGVGDVLQVVAAAQGLRFRGAMYDMADAPFDVFPKSVKTLPSSRRLL